MPRDLNLSGEKGEKPSSSSSSSPPITLSESPNRMSSDPSFPVHTAANSNSISPGTSTSLDAQRFIASSGQFMGRPKTSRSLHPLVRPLTISDLESCVALEDAAFEREEERATREKFEYRLTKCGELCFGLFATVVPGSTRLTSPTLSAAKVIESSRSDHAVSVLLGHIVSAKTTATTATDDSMGYPKDWNSANPKPSKLGHQEGGRTIVLHSVAVAPGHQGRGLGSVLMRAYVSTMNGAGIADRLVLLAHEDKVDWYEKLGFKNLGESEASFGGGGWHDMVYLIKSPEKRARYG